MKESREPEFPTEERLRVYGDLAFLAMRSAHHRKMSVSILQAALEPPILLGQYKIFRFDGIPRGALTWAWLSQDAEERYLEGEGFTFADWKSGDRLWIIDLMAPYKGLTAGIVRWVMKEGNMPEPRFSFRRVDGDRDTRKVVNIDITRRGNMAQVLQG
ncbi:MAG: toxin-activating lysine-acyltransferase [Boseongicola sp.]|nr:toxin-activating lysine-acyltransferase [Boseongicola sp.]